MADQVDFKLTRQRRSGSRVLGGKGWSWLQRGVVVHLLAEVSA
jgi:hypothetical protein